MHIPIGKTLVTSAAEDPSYPLPPHDALHTTRIPIVDDSKRSYDLTQSQMNSVESQTKRKDSAGLRDSRPVSNLAHQLSHKLSTTFGNPTVVHRPSLRMRPSLQSFHDDAAAVAATAGTPKPETGPQDDTDPSSYKYDSSRSPGDRSTGKTSLFSNITSPASASGRDRVERPIAQQSTMEDMLREKRLTPIEEAPILASPTVVTVETTANAKIFFETHFNSLLSQRASPRSQRRNELELRLQKEPLSAEQCQEERHAWAAQETEHLRQSRVLKSRTNGSIGSTGVSVAGYEVVRILGKGSFGVVRLVREKENGRRVLSTNSSNLTNTPKTAFEAFKATIDIPRGSGRRESGKPPKEVFAMKVIRKSDMLRNCQEGHLRAERDFLVASERSKWIVPLMASFQDSTNLYLVMEYMVGGDFLGLLLRKDILKEKKARWYIAEMILCVEEAHKLKWIHRDVKPDNFLISASGHLKISDFGLAFDGHWAHDQSYFYNQRNSLMEKLGIRVQGDSIDRKEGISIAAGMNLANVMMERKERHEKPQVDGPGEKEGILQWRNQHGRRKLAKSVVGTSQYMAPEVIRGELYDGRCDWWSIGIILYEVWKLPLF